MALLAAVVLIAAIRGAALMTALAVLHSYVLGVPPIGFMDSVILGTCISLIRPGHGLVKR